MSMYNIQGKDMVSLDLPLVLEFKLKSLFLIMSACMIFAYHADIATGAYYDSPSDPGIYSTAELEVIVEKYRYEVRVIDQQIHDTRKDLDWLTQKINGISASGRSVSYPLTDSVRAKEKKISLLEARKKRLLETLGLYQKAYDTIKGKENKSAKIQVPDMTKAQSSEKPSGKAAMPAKLSGIDAAIKKAGLEDWVEILGGDSGCSKINNTLPILFSSGSAELAKEYKLFLKKLAQFLKPYDVKVYVNGFADSDPINTKKYPSNFELGASRAASVVHEMVKNGLKSDIFKIGSTGEYRFPSKAPSAKKTFQRRAQLTVVFNS